MKKGCWFIFMWSLVVASLSVTGEAAAFGRWNHSRCGDFRFEADAIYWKPSGAITYIGVLDSPPLEGAPRPDHVYQDLFLHPDYNLGIRLQAAYMFPCSSLFVAVDFFTMHSRSHQKHVLVFKQKQGVAPVQEVFQNPFLTLSTAGDIIEGRGRVEWQGVDIVAGNYLINSCNFWGALYGGGHYAYVRDTSVLRFIHFVPPDPENNVSSSFDIDKFHLTRRFSGGGPIVGVEGHYCFCPGLQVAAFLTTGVLFGDRRLDIRRFSVTNGFESGLGFAAQKYGSDTVALPLVGGDLYAAYGLEWGCTSIAFKIGFHFRSYFDILPSWTLSEIYERDRLQTVTLAGPYGGISLTF